MSGKTLINIDYLLDFLDSELLKLIHKLIPSGIISNELLASKLGAINCKFLTKKLEYLRLFLKKQITFEDFKEYDSVYRKHILKFFKKYSYEPISEIEAYCNLFLSEFFIVFYEHLVERNSDI